MTDSPGSSEQTPKFVKGQRVFAKDESSGILYEAVIRRAIYGVGYHPKLPDDTEEEEVEKWHCFVHYLSWNVKWDRWVSEDCIYEINDKTRILAQKLHEAVKEAKKKHGRKSPQVMVELAQRMKRLELERRIEERREELAKQGIDLEEEDALVNSSKPETYTKKYFKKELGLRERSLQSKRKQVHAEKLVLPFSMKKILVDEWEVITQCNMVPTLPAAITIQQVLDKYLASKIGKTDLDDDSFVVPSMEEKSDDNNGNEVNSDNDKTNVEAATKQAAGESQAGMLEPETNDAEDGAVETGRKLKHGDAASESEAAKREYEADTDAGRNLQQPASAEGSKATKEDELNSKDDQAVPSEPISADATASKQEQEWKDMVDGIALLFDQALETRLLYRQELPQHEWIVRHQDFGTRRYSQVYGCEHLLCLFVRLPALLADQLSDAEARPIFSKLSDLVRYLQKHQAKVFLQSCQAPSRKREADTSTKRRAKKSRKTPLQSQETPGENESQRETSSAQQSGFAGTFPFPSTVVVVEKIVNLSTS